MLPYIGYLFIDIIYFCYGKIKSITLSKYFFGGGDFGQGPQNFLKISKLFFSKNSKIISK